ncbi:glycosyltransferase [Collinsella intestinalis]|uniref:glycosyltransferase n=1 Tax=Collinsella intestinalis TaxID=147207 RepID=UPI00195C6C6B|nr:glycosyltransferase [Collinsella intestinalis]MBM6908752.1 glycosyltransferase [Collinsella intestinalis]
MKIVFAVLQSLSANGICANAVIKECLRRGHKVVWICNSEAAAPICMEGLEFAEVAPRWIDAQLARFGNRSFIKKTLVAINRVAMFRALRSWPLVSKRYSERVSKAVAAASSDADIVIGAYTQIDAVIAAHEAKKGNPRLRFIAWYLDSFTGGHGPRFLDAEEIERRGKCWNRQLLENADAVVAMESSRRFHEERCCDEPWFDKLRFLDLPLLDISEAPDLQANVESSKTKTIVYAGTLPKGIRSPEFFINVLSFIPDESCCVLFVGDGTNRTLTEACARDRRIEVRGRVPHEEVSRLLSSADYLLTLGNRLANMTPSKIFEYMAFRKPIIATYPIDSEPSLPYLERYGDTLMLDERGDPSVAAEQLVGFLNASHEPISFDELKTRFWNNTPSAFCDLVETIGGEDGR